MLQVVLILRIIGKVFLGHNYYTKMCNSHMPKFIIASHECILIDELRESEQCILDLYVYI